MAFTAKDIMLRVQLVLNDAGAVRWTLPELRLWLNDGLREIVTAKPNANAKTVELPLQKGTYQVLPDTYVALMQITRNLTSVDASVNKRAGRAITTIQRATLDAIMPGWQDPAVLPYAAQVVHVIDNQMDPRTFFVAPGNDGTGTVEAIVSELPADIAEPINPLLIDSYTATVPLHDIYRTVLTDYVLYKAFSKETDVATASQRAVGHLTRFNDALGVKMSKEAELNVNTASRMA